MRKSLVLAIAMSVSLSFFQGCYGPFKLTRKVYDWNNSVESKWGREAMFLVLTIVPVYGFSAFADAILFNLIDFWGGENPISSLPVKKSRIIAKGDQQAVMTLVNEKKVRVDLFSHYRPQKSFIIERSAEGMSAQGTAGERRLRARTLDDGSVFIEDARGDEVACYLPEEDLP